MGIKDFFFGLAETALEVFPEAVVKKIDLFFSSLALSKNCSFSFILAKFTLSLSFFFFHSKKLPKI